MGVRKIIVKKTAAESIAAIAFFIESKGLPATAEKFSDAVYDYLLKLKDDKVSYGKCRDPKRLLMGYNCMPYKKKYVIVFMETSTAIIIHEFILAKAIHW